jgi:transposase
MNSPRAKTQTINRLHRLLLELFPVGAKRFLSATQAAVQLRNATEGRAYFDTKKAAGKTSMEAMRALKRRLSHVVYRRMVHDQQTRQAAGPAGHSGTTHQSSVTDLPPDIGSSDKPQPGPATTQPSPHFSAAS